MSKPTRKELPKRLSKIESMPFVLDLDCVEFIERNLIQAKNKNRKSTIDFYFLFTKHKESFGIVVFLLNEKYIELVHPAAGSLPFSRKNIPEYGEKAITHTSFYWKPTALYYRERVRVVSANLPILPERVSKIVYSDNPFDKSIKY